MASLQQHRNPKYWRYSTALNEDYVLLATTLTQLQRPNDETACPHSFSVFALTTAMPSLADDEAAPQSAASVPDTLNAAYQREYAFLIAEKKTLTQQLNTLQSRSEQRIQQAAAAVMDAENALFATQKRLETLDSELQALDRTLAKNDEDLAVFEAAWTQAKGADWIRCRL